MSEEARITGLAKQAAFRISRELSSFDTLPSPAREAAIQQVMQRVEQFRSGRKLTVEGPNLVREIIEEVPAELPKEEPPSSSEETPAA